jgi:hypothetical protein
LISNAWQFELASIGEPLENLIESDSLSLLKFSTQDYMSLSAVPQFVLHALHQQQIFATILNRPLQLLCAASSCPSDFNMLEDLPTIDINAEHVEISTEPSGTVIAVVNGRNHLPLMNSQERTTKVDVVVLDTNELDNDELPWQSWPGIMEEDYDELYRHLHVEYKDFDKHH